MSTEATNDDLFQGLVISLAAATMQHLGKTLNPLTHKTEKNLEAAQSSIDMLDMLSAKTQGNLSENESKLLTNVLAELKLNYVETLNEKPAEPAPEIEKSKEDADAAPAEPPPEQAD
ncbi:MAG: DUF1844 domain-containing protein [Kiritimatiellae bacterium]|jgi:hypothetical protein|nr:DUF1844 domain-containing protein [Kiritimatiellia bacterium]MDD4342719.1 DUF1844 domain-containing protein [Kiritimatiellia bacterium]MDY0150549.1 DUF1844 domain-containing protein [Kiritimatiellia bacterium]